MITAEHKAIKKTTGLKKMKTEGTSLSELAGRTVLLKVKQSFSHDLYPNPQQQCK